MEQRALGPSGILASKVALGTWAVGGSTWWRGTDDEESVRAIRAALDAGVNLIDTAPVYGFGHSEEIVGRAIAGRRHEAVVATKCGLWWKDERGAPYFELDGRRVRKSLRPETIRVELEDSLRRLGTEYVDLYQTHWQADPADPTPVADTMGCLLDLKRAGKIRAIGVSNATPAQMDEYRALGPVDASQPRYSLLDRRIEADLLPYCRAHGIAVLAYSPLEQGLLAGRFAADTPVEKGSAREGRAWLRAGNREKALAMIAGWDDLLRKYACTLAQLVIAWTVAQPGLTHALCGGRKAGHVRDNARAGELALEEADVRRLRADAEALGAPA